ncbi:hypothetical protein HanIR_Chr02g0059031 [Helianthus annuus]|nr:hypothetical protein HanIR_Chr02g0059031 [Helianthus annuus]
MNTHTSIHTHTNSKQTQRMASLLLHVTNPCQTPPYHILPFSLDICTDNPKPISQLTSHLPLSFNPAHTQDPSRTSAPGLVDLRPMTTPLVGKKDHHHHRAVVVNGGSGTRRERD